MNTFGPVVGQVIVRSPVTARMLRFPLTVYLSSSRTDEIVPPAAPTIVGRVTLVVVVVLFDVVDVFMLVVERNPMNGLVILRKDSSARFDDEPIDETTAPETRTESLTRSTPVSVNSPIVLSVPFVLPKNALLRVGHKLSAVSPGLYGVAHLKRVILFEELILLEKYGPLRIF